MSFRPSSSDREDEISRDAAAWIAKRGRGLSPAEQDDLFQWLAQDPRHGEWFALHQKTDNALKHLVQWRPEHGARPNPDLLTEPRPPVSFPRRALLWGSCTLAAAAGLAFALYVGSTGPRPEDGAVQIAAKGHPEPISVLRRVLDDGSIVDLNHGAEVEVRFTSTERRVKLLRGEAHFTVSKNTHWPFIVEANRVSVLAVGTAFFVQLQSETVEVLVTEGRVSVDPLAKARTQMAAEGTRGPMSGLVKYASDLSIKPALVVAGERALVALNDESSAPKIGALTPAELDRFRAWQPRKLEFSETPLAQVVAEFNRDDRVRITIDDPILAALPIGATLSSDNVEGFLRLLESSFRVDVERRASGEIVLRRAFRR
ncbi:MAG TPA: FecR domain-containing protein [Opitutaceae bacterium]|nr:FecR domain-containing protein [Opitutaceae bacterium]